MKGRYVSAHQARNERIIELAKTMGPAQILRILQADYPDLNRNQVIDVVHRYCPKDEKAKAMRKVDGNRSQRVAMAKRERPGTLGLASPTAEQRAKARPVQPRPVSDPAKRPPPMPVRSSLLDTPVPGSAPVPYGERKGCVWPFGEKASLVYCNREKCRVSKGDGTVHLVDYCDVHWEARRASKYTKILA